eukprot:CFRG0027T1
MKEETVGYALRKQSTNPCNHSTIVRTSDCKNQSPKYHQHTDSVRSVVSQDITEGSSEMHHYDCARGTESSEDDVKVEKVSGSANSSASDSNLSESTVFESGSDIQKTSHANRIDRTDTLPEQEVSFVIKQFIMSAYTSHQGTSVTQKFVPKVKVEVKAAMLVKDIPRAFHVYIIVVTTDSGVWTVHRRFSQFLEFHRFLTMGRKILQTKQNKELFDTFPKKRFFINPSIKIAKQRIEELDRYMQSVMSSPAAYEERFWTFVGVQSFARHFVPSHPLSQTLVTPAVIAHEFLHNSERTIAVALVEFAAKLLRSLVTGSERPYTPGVELPTLREMIVMLIHTGRMPFTSFTLSLLYVKQIRNLRGKHSIKGSPHLLLIAVLIVTAKFLYDEPPHPIVNNWFTPREIWGMELKILTGIQFNLNASSGDYSRFVRRMNRTIAKRYSSSDYDLQWQKQVEAKQLRTWDGQPLFGGEESSTRLGTWIYLSDSQQLHSTDVQATTSRKAIIGPTTPDPGANQSSNHKTKHRGTNNRLGTDT